MDFSHLLNLISELPPNSSMNYVRGNNSCTFVTIDRIENRLYAITPEGKDISFSESYLMDLADSIVENTPFNTSQILNNKGSNRAVIDSIVANTSEMYWIEKKRAKYVVWIPEKPHKAGMLVEWKDMDFLSTHSALTENTIEGCVNPDKVKQSFLLFWRLVDEHGAEYHSYISVFQDVLNPLLNEYFAIEDVFEITDVNPLAELI